ncbi:hypothetical protein MKX01_001032, partial [Papaver californicum]
MEHLQIFECRGLPYVLARLFRYSIKENKEIARECIRLCLIDPKTNSGFFLPRSIQNQCAAIVLRFCVAFYRTTNDEERQLYNSCRVFKRNFCEFEFFSLHICSAIADHLKVKGLSLPLNQDDSEKLGGIYIFHLQCLNSFEVAISIWDAGGNWKFNIGWSYLLFILKELNNIGKVDDHLWLLKRILMAMVFPEVKNDNRNPHKMLIDRSLLLKESFEHIALFKDEVATCHGVLREWFILVCQALF